LHIPDDNDKASDIVADDLEDGELPVRSIEPFSSKKLFQDMQERLLLMSHYRLQQTLDTAPSMN